MKLCIVCVANNSYLCFKDCFNEMYADFNIKQVMYNLFSSVLVICHFNIHLTEVCVMHETAGYVYSIWRIW